jgi:hypothetical protein
LPTKPTGSGIHLKIPPVDLWTTHLFYFSRIPSTDRLLWSEWYRGPWGTLLPIVHAERGHSIRSGQDGRTPVRLMGVTHGGNHRQHFHLRLLVWALSMIRPTDGRRRCDNLHDRPKSAGRPIQSELHALDGVERNGLFCRARNCLRQLFERIGKDQHTVAGATERDLELLAID